MGTLNRSKPFGTICGIAAHRYEQGGRLYDQDGNEVDKDGNLIEKPVKDPQVQPNLPIDANLVGAVFPETEDMIEDPALESDPGPTGDGYGTREEVIVRLEELQIPYNPKSRRSKLIELLKPKAG